MPSADFAHLSGITKAFKNTEYYVIVTLLINVEHWIMTEKYKSSTLCSTSCQFYLPTEQTGSRGFRCPDNFSHFYNKKI